MPGGGTSKEEKSLCLKSSTSESLGILCVAGVMEASQLSEVQTEWFYLL